MARDAYKLCAGFVTVGSKTFKTANRFYSDELVDTGIGQELIELLAMCVMLAMMKIPEHDRDSWETWSRKRARLFKSIATRRQRKTAHLEGERNMVGRRHSVESIEYANIQ